MLVILSPDSVSSMNVMAEVAYALDERRQIIPVLYRECKVPFRLRPFQYVHFRSDDNYSLSLGELLTTIGTEEAATSSPRSATVQSLWTVGEGGAILHTENGGDTWEKQPSGTINELHSVAFGTPQSGWAVGSFGSSGVILHTEDGGRSWYTQSIGIFEELNSVVFGTPQSGWAVGKAGTILHTEDGGGTWKPQSGDTREQLEAVAFLPPQSVWTVGWLAAILHTEDGGRNWQKLRNATDLILSREDRSNGTEVLTSVAFATPQSGWVVGEYGAIWHTEDSGRSWLKQVSPTAATLACVIVATPQLGWATGEGGTILHTEDGGATWKMQNSGTSEYLRCVAFVTPQSGWAVGDSGTILHTEDGGVTWKTQNSGTIVALLSVACAKSQ
jgi:photosystem II stability/assembly factor-like uncharacterized protein